MNNYWTKEQLKLAFHLYCQLPFGRLHRRNPEFIELAPLINRTPSAVAMKLVNFASLDPAIINTGRSGLGNASALDRQVWDEFQSDWEKLTMECVELSKKIRINNGDEPILNTPSDHELDFIEDFTGETQLVIINQRIKQNFFRRMVLSSYQKRCCMSGLSEQRLLIASHIVPWSKDKKNRLNPRNGLCLSALHDKAFDQGLITLTDDLRIVISSQLHCKNDKFIKDFLLPLDGCMIELPERFLPDPQLIYRHQKEIFIN